MEKLLDIKGYEGLYKVSNLGYIVSTRNGNVLKTDKKICNHTTYHRVSLSLNGEVKRFQVHRLVAEAFIENNENKPYVNHLDNNGSNNRADNLEWCTHSENMMHSQNQGRLFETQSKAGKKASVVIKDKAMAKHKQMIGKQYGKWTVLSIIEKTRTNWYCLCICECGNEREVNLSTVSTGKSKMCRSCGVKEFHRNRKIKI